MVTCTGSHLCDFEWNAIAQDFPVEALLGHVAGEPAGPLEGIFQPLQLHIGDWKKQRRQTSTLVTSTGFITSFITETHGNHGSENNHAIKIYMR